MNPLKCAFGVHAWDFLGFMVHKRGIEINQNKTKAILDLKISYLLHLEYSSNTSWEGEDIEQKHSVFL